ncbi:uncharacterized protein LOC129592840 [Paramacrobiotus metropolitanus]|uniref:uncharacterized protein LOC129592840 n=1 Tax=Paramacrobiotus metropolitanus TaxID=2943436 RepID=UPI002445FAF8|nr:uncharacterized protein LOC129592840 [Paramacrobiotus metropolitanus]
MFGYKYLAVIVLIAHTVRSQSQQPANARQGLGCVLAPPSAVTSDGDNSKSDSAQPADTTASPALTDNTADTATTEAVVDITTSTEREILTSEASQKGTPAPAPFRPSVQSTAALPPVKALPTIKEVVAPARPVYNAKKASQWAAQNDKSSLPNQREGKAAKNNVQLLQASAPAPAKVTVPIAKKPSSYKVPGAIFVAGEQDSTQGTQFHPDWKDQTTVNNQGNVWDELNKLRGRDTLSAGEVQEILARAIPGTDYPTYSYVPSTKFSCESVNQPGYYADTEAQCQVIRRCDANGLKWNYLCPNSTLFNQITLTCDWYFNVDCSRTSQYYDYSNSRLYHSDLFFLGNAQ